MDLTIKTENLGKQYRLGVINRGMLYKDIQSWWARLRGQEDPNAPVHVSQNASTTGQTFWAFRDIDFSVQRGEILGIIGRNGAGKSTLLKVLSQITAPSEGNFKLNGRVASLLEVGTGFHGELTGRENIYLNGAILGMSRAEVRSRFEEIVEFAEVGKFVDTPVKRYSSGMYVRLAFSVAAHLQPDILIVDEVLAVGDAAFQKKCLGRMDEAAFKEGRTILFVSHNMTSVKNLCTRAILLKNGRLADDGKAGEVVDRYLEESSKLSDQGKEAQRVGSGRLRAINISFAASDGHRLEELPVGEPVSIQISYTAEDLSPTDEVTVGIGVVGSETAIFNNYSNYSGKVFNNLPKTGTFTFTWPPVDLIPGSSQMVVRIVANGDHHTGEVLDMPAALPLHIASADYYGTGRNTGLNFGTVLVRGDWSLSS
ncbi:MAG: ABC transporter ATP-binding protein [Chthoniobacterales bacterium]